MVEMMCPGELEDFHTGAQTHAHRHRHTHTHTHQKKTFTEDLLLMSLVKDIPGTVEVGWRSVDQVPQFMAGVAQS